MLTGAVVLPTTNAELQLYFQTHVVAAKDETKRIIDVLMPDFEKVLAHVNEHDGRFPRLSQDVVGVGSYYQGLKVRRSDEFDFTLCLNKLDSTWRIVPWSGSNYGFKKLDPNLTEDLWTKAHTEPVERNDSNVPTNLHTTLDKCYTIVDRASLLPPAHGYMPVSLNAKLPDFVEYSRDPCLLFKEDLVPYLVKVKFKEYLAAAVESCRLAGKFTLSPSAHGPALTLKYEHPHAQINFPISIDITPAIRWTGVTFEQLGIQWPRNESAVWLSTEEINAIKQKGLLLVAKINFYWRISFAECEKQLCKFCDRDGGCRKKVHRIMKSFHEKLWCPGNNPQISSYIIKSVWMWMMDTLPQTDLWQEEHLSERLFDCIRSLLNYVNNGSLPHYFDVNDDLLKDKDKTELRQEFNVICKSFKAAAKQLPSI